MNALSLKKVALLSCLCASLGACSQDQAAPVEEAPVPAGASGEISLRGQRAPTNPAAVYPGHPSVQAVGALAPPADYVAVPGERESLGGVDLNPTPEASARLLRRMSVPQLRDAISNATGGLVWRDERGQDVLGLLEATLGVPNYIDTTNEDLDASLVFQKFLGDGARQICDELVEVDLQSAPDQRVLMKYADPELVWEQADAQGQASMDQNLRYLKLRFTGQFVAADQEEGIARERWLLRSVTHATGSPARGWRAVCVGLMTSPEFYLY